ncbi:MAG: ATP-binding protein [bacterium]|nr:ATP-binding protein [bacterium]
MEGKRLYVFLDEFQYLKNAGMFLKVVFDQLKEKIQLIVSGSSSLEISKCKEFLTGRKIEFQITPFSFNEYIRGCTDVKSRLFSLDNFDELNDFYLMYRDELTVRAIDYMNWGGYPEPCLEKGERKTLILREIISTYLQKDIAGFLNIGKLDAYNNLLRLMATQIGNLVNKNELANTLRLNMETVNKYLNVLEGTYVFSLVSPYFTNVRKEISKMQKIYVGDAGLRRVILNALLHQSPDSISGAELENFVYIHTRNMKGIRKINYYRTVSKAEIDFILHQEGALIPLEVKYRKNVKRVPAAIKNFLTNYPELTSRTITVTRDDIYREGENYFIPYIVFPFIRLD